MSRIAETFARLRRAGEKGLVVYLTAGDPDGPTSLAYLRAAVEGGADIVEVGVPFSDPMADGPAIQAASRRALSAGMTVDGVLSLVARLREGCEVPIVLFGYYNPFFRRGVRRVFRAARKAGADGLLVVDLPLEEWGEAVPEARKAGLDWIPLTAPTSGSDRIRRAAGSGSGFLYLISVTGTTGERRTLPRDLSRFVLSARAASRLPVAVGFGISSPAMARAAARHADAAVVGSACVRIVERAGKAPSGPAELARFVRSLKSALR